MLTEFATEEGFRDAVARELAEYEHLGHRIGLALTAAPLRERFDDDYLTVGWAFQTAAVPAAVAAVSAPEPQFDPDPDPEPEPELAVEPSDVEVAEALAA